MARRERRSRQWWQQTVRRWRKSGLSAASFAEEEGLQVGTLRWWSSRVKHATRATHGASVVPIEIAVPGDARDEHAGRGGTLEIAVGAAVVRVEVGTDVQYVGALVNALRGS